MPINGFPEPNMTALDSLYSTIRDMQRRLDSLESGVDQAPWSSYTLELSQNAMGSFSALALNNTYSAKYRRRSGSIVGRGSIRFVNAPGAGTNGESIVSKAPVIYSDTYLDGYFDPLGYWRAWDASAGVATGGIIIPYSTDQLRIQFIGWATGGYGNWPNTKFEISDELYWWFDYETGEVTSL